MQSIYADEFHASDFTFTAAEAWNIETTEDWLTVTPANGEAGVNTIEIATAGNYTEAARRGTIYINSGEFQIAVIVDQSELTENGDIPANPEYIFKVVEGDKDMTIFADEFSFPEFKMFAPDKWSRELTFEEGSSEWLVVEGASNGNQGEYGFDITPMAINITGKEMSAKLTFTLTADAAKPEAVEALVINFTHKATAEDGNPVQLKFNYESGEDSDREIDANQTEFKSFVFRAEAVWSAKLNGLEWCSVSPTEGIAGEYTITIAANALNDSAAAKSGSIELSYDEDPAANPNKLSLNFAQNNTVAGNVFTFDFANANTIETPLAYAGGDAELTFDAPFAWAATSSSDWLKLAQSEGVAGTACKIAASAGENTVNAENSAVVTVKSTMPNYEGKYAELTYNIVQAANPDGAKPIKYSTTIAKFSAAEAFAAFQEGRYILEITDGGEVTDADLLDIETYLKPGGDGKPEAGSVILSLPYITRIITSIDKIEGANVHDDFVFNGSNAIRELWMSSLTIRPHKLWNLANLEVLYMPKAGGEIIYDLFKTTGQNTASGGLSVMVIGVDPSAVINYEKSAAFKRCGNLSECKFYTSEANKVELEQALVGSKIDYGPIITDEIYTLEDL